MIFLDNGHIAKLLDMELTMRALREGYEDLEHGDAAYIPRIDVFAPSTKDTEYYRWGSMTGVCRHYGVAAVRIKSDVLSWPSGATVEKYCIEEGTYSGIILVYAIDNGEPLALMHDGWIQHMRVGGTAGIGTDVLARHDARRLGILGSGGMARTFLDAIAQVRPLEQVDVYSPTRKHREEFVEEIRERHRLVAHALDNAEDVVRGADIVASCTDSMMPTFRASWLAPGTHVVTVGGSREIGEDVWGRADVVARTGDESFVTRGEPGMAYDIKGGSPSYITGSPAERARVPKGVRPTRGEIPLLFPYDTTKARPARLTPDDVTLYLCVGTQGLQFAAVAGAVYRRAREQGIGAEMPLEWFVQDIRD